MSGPTGGAPEEAWVREATRLHRRYVEEIVEHYGLCPWAARARLGDKLRVEVSVQEDEALAVSVDTLARWAKDAAMEVGFLVFPRLDVERPEFDAFVTRIRTVDGERHALGRAPFAMVGFHPRAEARVQDAERLIPFLRRTPDPTIQIIRIEVLERVRGAQPEGTQFVDSALVEMAAGAPAVVTVRQQVGLDNLDTVRRLGVPEITKALDDIRSDRDRTYAALRAGSAP